MSVIVAVAFGGEFNNDWMAQKWSELMQEMNNVFVQDMLLGPIYKYLPLGTAKFWKIRNEVVDEVKKAIAHRRGTLKQIWNTFLGKVILWPPAMVKSIRNSILIPIIIANPIDDDKVVDLMSAMMKINDAESALSDQDIVDQCLTFLFAGHDTTGTSWYSPYIFYHY